MTRIKVGDLFELNTTKGKAYLHYIHTDNTTRELVRVLQGLYSERPTSFDLLVASAERYIISFPLSAAKKKNIVEIVGYYPASNFSKPKMMRTKHIIRGEFLGWHIINTDTWHRQLVQTLTPEQKMLSPWGIWNDTLLIENIISDWSLDEWE
ncbi:MAG: hypothetical protein JNL32_00410 [Candidatus Kapabacteria bacterium]|nr:hypothetical protein [Candidatus Kapabacteria bacterium]